MKIVLKCSKCKSSGTASGSSEESIKKLAENGGAKWINGEYVCAVCTGIFLQKMQSNPEAEQWFLDRLEEE
jgi:hypothetical protein